MSRCLGASARGASVRLATFAAGVLGLTMLLSVVPSPALAAFPTTSTPQLQLDHVLQTSPFAGSSVSMQDDEGSAYVARDHSLWLADDNGKMLYEVNPATGALKRTIGRKALEAVTQYGGRSVAGSYRDLDLESLAYDATSDVLYAFSGSCCTSTVQPTVFRLTRAKSGRLQPESYQPLANGSEFTAAAWNPADATVYVGGSSSLQTYDYVTNTAGPAFGVTNVTGIYGLTFSPDGADLYVARRNATLSRVDWATRSLVPGWTFDLTPFGVRDARGVEVFDDRFWVSDGYDSRAAGDPLSHAVFVLGVAAPSTAAPPTASFTTSPSSGTAPLDVTFTDTSTGSPTSWQWDFGDGGSATSQSPNHTYAGAGTYTVRLTATNAGGSDSATGTVVVTSSGPQNLVGNPGFEDGTTGWSGPLTRVAGGHSGSWACRLTNSGTSAATITLNDHPNWVATTSAGTYTARVWVRSDVAGATAYLKLREYNGATKVGETSARLVLSTEWQQLTVSAVPAAPGSSTLDLTSYVYNAAAGSSFDADDVEITLA